ncbi:MAG: hypothetical protein WAU37_06080 [Formosimonas sp.]
MTLVEAIEGLPSLIAEVQDDADVPVALRTVEAFFAVSMADDIMTYRHLTRPLGILTAYRDALAAYRQASPDLFALNEVAAQAAINILKLKESADSAIFTLQDGGHFNDLKGEPSAILAVVNDIESTLEHLLCKKPAYYEATLETLVRDAAQGAKTVQPTRNRSSFRP